MPHVEYAPKCADVLVNIGSESIQETIREVIAQ